MEQHNAALDLGRDLGFGVYFYKYTLEITH